MPFSLTVPGEAIRVHDELRLVEIDETYRWTADGDWLRRIGQDPISDGFDLAARSLQALADDDLITDLTFDGPSPQPGGTGAVY